jgi:hypothetical protein
MSTPANRRHSQSNFAPRTPSPRRAPPTRRRRRLPRRTGALRERSRPAPPNCSDPDAPSLCSRALRFPNRVGTPAGGAPGRSPARRENTRNEGPFPGRSHRGRTGSRRLRAPRLARDRWSGRHERLGSRALLARHARSRAPRSLRRRPSAGQLGTHHERGCLAHARRPARRRPVARPRHGTPMVPLRGARDSMQSRRSSPEHRRTRPACGAGSTNSRKRPVVDRANGWADERMDAGVDAPRIRRERQPRSRRERQSPARPRPKRRAVAGSGITTIWSAARPVPET